MRVLRLQGDRVQVLNKQAQKKHVGKTGIHNKMGI